jgi:hypothetical protein
MHVTNGVIQTAPPFYHVDLVFLFFVGLGLLFFTFVVYFWVFFLGWFSNTLNNIIIAQFFPGT